VVLFCPERTRLQKPCTQLHLTLSSARPAPTNNRSSSPMSFSQLFCDVSKHLTGLTAGGHSSAFHTARNQVHDLHSCAALHHDARNKHRERDRAELTHLLQPGASSPCCPSSSPPPRAPGLVPPLPVFSGGAGIVPAKLSFQSAAVARPAALLAFQYNEISTKAPRCSEPLR